MPCESEVLTHTAYEYARTSGTNSILLGDGTASRPSNRSLMCTCIVYVQEVLTHCNITIIKWVKTPGHLL